jgi:oligopeptide transport system substrate-binding protein
VAEWEGYRVNADGSKVQEDLDAAKALLESSGYGPNNPLEFDIMVRTVSVYPTAAVFLKEQFELTGLVDVSIDEVESVAGLKRQASGEFQMSYRIIAPTTDDPDGVFLPIYLPGGSENAVKYEDPRIVDIFNKQTKELDPAKRRDLLKQAEDILMEGKSHWFQIGWGPSFGVTSVKIKNQGNWPGQYGDYLRPGDMLAELDHIWYDPDAPLYDPDKPYPDIS